MGGSVAKHLPWGHPRREFNVAFIGLDASGKTTALYRLKTGDVVTTIPTIGFNVESVKYKGVTLTSWDIGGRNNLRALWRYYFENTNGLVFMVDANDQERLEDAKEQLRLALQTDALSPDVPVVIFANKQDLPRAVTSSEIEKSLDLLNVCKGRPWRVQSCSVALESDAGFVTGLSWLLGAMSHSADDTSDRHSIAGETEKEPHTVRSVSRKLFLASL